MAAPASFRPRLAAPALLDRSTALLCVLAAAGIVVQQELRTPLHVPGHRGLLWLGLLVAVRLAARRPGPTLAVAVSSAALIAGLRLAPEGPLAPLPYVLAAALLDATALVPWLVRRPWIVAGLAAPIHLVALVVPAWRSLLVGVAPTALAQGMTSVAVLHLCFGAGAGLLGWGLAAAWGSLLGREAGR
jgi:hypothetical protein